MTKKYLLITMILGTLLFFTACEKKDPDVNGGELITTLNYTLTPSGGGTAITLSFQDLDGDGGIDPVITGGTLSANQTYEGTIELLNESVTPVENITEEVDAEDEDHQFFFQSNMANLTVEYTDQDEAGNPVGITSTLSTGAMATGSITITLRHLPNKSAAGVSEGNIANAGGETDIQVTIPVDVQ